MVNSQQRPVIGKQIHENAVQIPADHMLLYVVIVIELSIGVALL